MSTAQRPLVVGRDLASTVELARHLDAQLISTPPDPEPGSDIWSTGWCESLDAWGAALRDGPSSPFVAICAWSPLQEPGRFAERSPTVWMAAVEYELGLWFEAAVAAARRCEDRGSIVIVAERPAALDAAGHAEVVTVAEGLATLARSLGINEGDRGVRVNLVATELRTAPAELLGLAPLLDSFPGTVEREVAGAVRLLWSDDAAGITGSVVCADSGRSW